MKRQRRALASEVGEGAAPGYGRRRSVLAHADPRLHSFAGKLDARRIAARLGVPLKRLAPALGYTPQGLSKNPTSDNLQVSLAEIAYVLNRLRSLVADDRSVAIWLRAPHPDLGGSTPLSYILSGRTSAVNALLHLAEAGQTS